MLWLPWFLGGFVVKSVVLRFAGLQQSWGVGSFGRRLTARVPTRSGIEGHFAAVLGARRGEWPAWLATLDVVVRVDSPGRITHDYHTVNPPEQQVIRTRTRTSMLGALKPNGAPLSTTVANFTVPIGEGKAWKIKSVTPTLVSTRDYLVGSEFIVAISGADEWVDMLAQAAQQPVFMPYLGRKSCAPAFPYYLGVRQGTPEEVLTDLPTVAGTSEASLPLFRITGTENQEFRRATPPRIEHYSEWKTI